MFRKTVLILVGQIALFLAGPAFAEDIEASDLIGHWAVTGTCGDQSIEHLEFRGDGSFQQKRGGEVQALGFWRMLAEGVVDLHLISSPAFFDDKLADMVGYYYFPVKVIFFNVQKDQVEAVGLLGRQVERAVFTRCK